VSKQCGQCERYARSDQDVLNIISYPSLARCRLELFQKHLLKGRGCAFVALPVADSTPRGMQEIAELDLIEVELVPDGSDFTPFHGYLLMHMLLDICQDVYFEPGCLQKPSGET
jgi:hypothetical protein